MLFHSWKVSLKFFYGCILFQWHFGILQMLYEKTNHLHNYVLGASSSVCLYTAAESKYVSDRNLRGSSKNDDDSRKRHPIIKSLLVPVNFPSSSTGNSFENMRLREKYEVLKKEYDEDKELLKNPGKRTANKQPTIYDLELKAPQHNGGIVGGVKKNVSSTELDMNTYQPKKLWETSNAAKSSAVDRLASNMDPETLNMLGKGATFAGDVLGNMIGGVGGAALGNAMNTVGHAAVKRAESMEAAGIGRYINYLSGLPCQPAPNKHWCLPEPTTTTSTLAPSLFQLRKYAEKKVELENGRRQYEQYLQERNRNPFVEPVDESEFESIVNNENDEHSVSNDKAATKQNMLVFDIDGKEKLSESLYSPHDLFVEVPVPKINRSEINDLDPDHTKKSENRITAGHLEAGNSVVSQAVDSMCFDECDLPAAVASYSVRETIPPSTLNYAKKSTEPDSREWSKIEVQLVENGDFPVSDKSNSSSDAEAASMRPVLFDLFRDLDMTGETVKSFANEKIENSTKAVWASSHKKWRQRNSGEAKLRHKSLDKDDGSGFVVETDTAVTFQQNEALVGKLPKEEISVFTPEELSLTAPTPAPYTAEEIAKQEREKRRQDRRDIRIERAINQYTNTYADDLRRAATYQDYKINDSTHASGGVWQNDVRLRVREERRKEKEAEKKDQLRKFERQKLEAEAEKHRLPIGRDLTGKERKKDVFMLSKSTANGHVNGEKHGKSNDVEGVKNRRHRKIVGILLLGKIKEKNDEYALGSLHDCQTTHEMKKDCLSKKKKIFVGESGNVLLSKNRKNLKFSSSSTSTSSVSLPSYYLTNNGNLRTIDENKGLLLSGNFSESLTDDKVQTETLSLARNGSSYMVDTPVEILLADSLFFSAPSAFTSTSSTPISSNLRDEFVFANKLVDAALRNNNTASTSVSNLNILKHLLFAEELFFDCRNTKNRRCGSVVLSELQKYFPLILRG